MKILTGEVAEAGGIGIGVARSLRSQVSKASPTNLAWRNERTRASRFCLGNHWQNSRGALSASRNAGPKNWRRTHLLVPSQKSPRRLRRLTSHHSLVRRFHPKAPQVASPL